MREDVRHLNGQTPAGVLMLHGQTAQGMTVRGPIVDKIPAPHGVVALGRQLERHPGLDLLLGLSLRHFSPALAPDSMDPFEIAAPSATPQKAFGKAIAPLRITLRHSPEGLGQPWHPVSGADRSPERATVHSQVARRSRSPLAHAAWATCRRAQGLTTFLPAALSSPLLQGPFRQGTS